MNDLEDIMDNVPSVDHSEARSPDSHDFEQAVFPVMVIVGSLSGATRKDALAYAKGLAEGQCVALEEVRIGLWKDKAKARWVYEVHEGGAGFSYLEPYVLSGKLHELPLRIELTDGRSADVTEFQDELVTVINPPKCALKACTVLRYSDRPMNLMRPDGKLFLKCTSVLFGVSMGVFVLASASSFALGKAFKEGWIAPSIQAAQASRAQRHSLQLLDELDMAKQQVVNEKVLNPRAFITRLHFDGRNWHSEISQVAPDEAHEDSL